MERWEALFADLEGQLDAAAAAELAGEVAERARYEVGRLRLVDRLRAAQHGVVAVQAAGAGQLAGRFAAVGSDWVLLAEPGGREVVVPLHAVMHVIGLAAWSTTAVGPVASRLTLAHALRGLVRDRAGVSLRCIDGTPLGGTLDRVGADFVELAEHPAGEARRRGVVQGVRTVPFAALGAVRRT